MATGRDIAILRQVYDETMSSESILEASVLHTQILLKRIFGVTDVHVERAAQQAWTAVCASTHRSPFEVFSWFVKGICRGSALSAMLVAVTRTLSTEALVSPAAVHQFLDTLLAGCKISGYQLLSSGEHLAVGELEHWLVDAVLCDSVAGHDHEPTVASTLRAIENWQMRGHAMAAMRLFFSPPLPATQLNQEDVANATSAPHFPAAWIRLLLFFLISFIEFPAFWCNYFAAVASSEIAAHYVIPISAIGSLASINTVGFVVSECFSHPLLHFFFISQRWSSDHDDCQYSNAERWSFIWIWGFPYLCVRVPAYRVLCHPVLESAPPPRCASA